jgi:5-methylcytosine-specific restriction enzyme A
MTAKLANPAASTNPRREWYGLQIWRNRRAHQLRVEPLCAICLEQNRVTGATVADHHPPHMATGKFVLGELRSLCAPCHDALQGYVHRGYSREIGPDGYPVDPAHPFYRGRSS